MGRYEVVIAKYGTRIGRRAEVYLNYPLYGEPDDDIGMDYFFWVIRNDERTVVVDTGFSTAGGASRRRTTLMPPAELFARLGVDPGTAPTVVITHAHYAHTGNLDLFPSSPIVLARREFEFWSGPHARRRQFHHSVEDVELAALRQAHEDGRLRLFDDELELAPGIRLAEVGGHTPGQLVVQVDTEDGTVLLASDAVHYYEELDRDMPFMSVAELVRMYEGFDLIRGLSERGEIAHVVAGHDPDTLRRYPASTEPGLEGLVSTIGRTA